MRKNYSLLSARQQRRRRRLAIDEATAIVNSQSMLLSSFPPDPSCSTTQDYFLNSPQESKELLSSDDHSLHDTNGYSSDVSSNTDSDPLEPMPSLNDNSLINDSPSSVVPDKETPSLKAELREWCKCFNITNIALTNLLHILRSHSDFGNLPLDSRTLLKTPRSVNVRNDVAGGSYAYFGVASGIGKVFSNTSFVPKYHELIAKTMNTENMITISANIDGLPIRKSSHISLWPILAVVDQDPEKVPFVVALFESPSKPNSADEYLREFVDELKKLESQGLLLGETVYKFAVSCIIADAPARAFIKNTLSHNAFHGCGKCCQVGVHRGRTVWLYNPDFELRTDEAFSSYDYPLHQISLSILHELNIGLVTQFPLDPMHLIYLGIMKKLLSIWFGGPKIPCRHAKLSKDQVNVINQRLSLIKYSLPREFHRKPRPIHDYHFWKATEFRTFLLYIGPVVLKGLLSDDLYNHFLILHTIAYILTDSDIGSKKVMIDYAEKLTHLFLKHLGTFYSPDLYLYNFHNLLHLPNDVRNYGSLNEFSAFPFENHMTTLKRMIRGPNKPIEQICKRLGEITCHAIKKSTNFIKLDNVAGLSQRILHFKDSAIADNCLVSCSPPDNCFLTKDNRLLLIKSMTMSKESKISLHCLVLTDKDDFTKYPAPSSNYNINKVKVPDNGVPLEIFSKEDLHKKCILLPIFSGTNIVLSENVSIPFASNASF